MEKKLLRYLSTPIDGFIDIPTGTPHAIGKGVLTYNISRNADLTLRLYDYDRIDPATHKKREIQQQEVFENVNIPDKRIEFQMFPASFEFGCKVTRYGDEPGLYTIFRLQIDEKGKFLHDRFAFYTCVKGQGQSMISLFDKAKQYWFQLRWDGCILKERWIFSWHLIVMKMFKKEL